MSLSHQLIWLFVIALPIACVSWTVTHEDLFLETREFCKKKATDGKSIFTRKLFYMLTCEYCFSHYVTIFFLIVTDFKLLLYDWRGYLLAGFALVWIANIYMSIYALIKIDIKKERIITRKEEENLK